MTILEANANRVGGRIKTFHAKKGEPPPFTDPAQYAEAGAMRLPSFHPLTLALIDKLGLKRRLFFNVDVDPSTGNQTAPVPPVIYKSFKDGKIWTYGDPSPEFREPDKRNHTWIRTNRAQVRRAHYAKDPSQINEGFHLTGCESRLTVSEMVNQALEPVRDYYSVLQSDGKRVNKPFKEWLDGWAGVIRDFDGYSMGRFLREYAGFSDEAVEAVGTIENMTSRLHLAFFHSFLGRSDIDPSATYWEVEGGSRKLPEALAKDLRDQIVMGQRMVRLEYYDPGRDGHHGGLAGPGGPAVAIQTVPEGDPYGEVETWTGDLAIVTIPFSSLRFTTVTPAFSYKKRRAVIETHYDQATKVLLEFSRRWWEFTEEDWKRELDAIAPGLYDYYQQRGEDDAEAALAVPPSLRELPTGLLGAHPSVDEQRISPQQVEYYRNSRCAAVYALPRMPTAAVPPPTTPTASCTTPRTPSPAARAVWCWRATPGRMTPRAGTPSRTPSATATPCSTSSRYTAAGSRSSTPALPDPELAARPVRLRGGRRLHPAPDDQLPPRCGAARGAGALRR